MGMLFIPKILGGIIVLCQHRPLKEFGGFFGLIGTLFCEFIFSALIAPIMMLFQTKIVFDILLGIDAGWSAQNRDATGTPWLVAIKRHSGHVLLGIIVTVIVYLYAPSLFYWILPITVGLILSVFISVWSSKESVGQRAKKCHLFLIPEEYEKPNILKMAEQAKQDIINVSPSEKGIDLLINNPYYQSLHIYMLSVNGPEPDFEIKTIRQVVQKVQGFAQNNLLDLSPEEEKYCLYHPEILTELSLLNTMNS